PPGEPCSSAAPLRRSQASRRSADTTLKRHHWLRPRPLLVAVRRLIDERRDDDLLSMAVNTYAHVSWERMANAIERVRARLLRASRALTAAGVPYAVAGGNAIAAWVSRVDETAVRNTQDVDIILRRADLGAATRALEEAGFIRRHVAGIEMFLDGPQARARDAVHVVLAVEKV